MITFQQHLINSRTLTTRHSIESELTVNPNFNYLFDLSYLAVLSLEGEKGLEYLQGQVTCDVRPVVEGRICQGALCNLKGRILALMDIIQWKSLKLILPQDLIDSTHNSLIKTAQLSRVTLEPEEFSVYGFYLKNPKDLLPIDNFSPELEYYSQINTADYCYYNLGNGYYIFIVPKQRVSAFCQPFINSNRFLGSLTWHTLQLAQKHIEIYPETRGLFLPHRLYLHQTPYLSFNKGCYKGQEVIARMHYKATLKHDFKIFKIQTPEKIYSGQLIKKIEDDVELGELVDYSKIAEQTYLIALSILKTAPQRVLLEGHSAPIILDIEHLN